MDPHLDQVNPESMAESHTSKSPQLPSVSLGIALSTPGVLALLFYIVVDQGLLLVQSRTSVKGFADQHFLLCAAVVLPSVLVFGVCLIFKVIEWAGPSAGRDHKITHRLAYLISVLLLFFVGFAIGNSSPIWWVIIQTGSLQVTVWSAPFVFLTAALAAEGFCPNRHRKWLRPLVWSAVIGSLVLLVHLLVIDWKIDLTIWRVTVPVLKATQHNMAARFAARIAFAL